MSTILLYLLRRLEPEAFRDNIDIKTFTVTPSNPAWEEFKPGLLAYVYWFINDFGSLIKIQDSDYLLIDTKDHDESVHPFNVNYRAKLYNKDNEIRGY